MPSEVAMVEPPADYAAAPAHQAGYDDNVHFFVTRQYVAYQKQIVILSPPSRGRRVLSQFLGTKCLQDP